MIKVERTLGRQAKLDSHTEAKVVISIGLIICGGGGGSFQVKSASVVWALMISDVHYVTRSLD